MVILFIYFLLFFFKVEACASTTKISEFDGSYSRTNMLENNYPIYVHSENWKAEWIGSTTGFWRFFDPVLSNGQMYDLELTYVHYPVSGHSWRYFNDDFQTQIIRDLPIYCVDTPTPTRDPSASKFVLGIHSSPTDWRFYFCRSPNSSVCLNF